MFGLSFFEILVVGIIALIFIGPKRLPDLARKLGELVRDFQGLKGKIFDEFNKATTEVKQEVKEIEQQTTQNVAQIREEIETIEVSSKPIDPSDEEKKS